MTKTICLDFGTTQIKGAHFQPDGRLQNIVTIDAPLLAGRDLIRESDGLEYLKRTETILRKFIEVQAQFSPIGIACQRSTFLLWDRQTGKPLTPLISWQDRRAHAWCRQNSTRFDGLGISTGLPLSPHYVGPKLAFLFETDKQLRTQAVNGDLAFGTLETFCLYHWSREKEHRTDLSMAARTMLADPVKGIWSEQLLSFFGVPVQLLPEITPTYGKKSLLLQGGGVTATMSDQAAAVVSELNGHKTDVTMINLGTGGFVIVPTGGRMQKVEGYLAGPLYKSPEGDIGYAVEGTVNGIARALAGFQDMQMPASPANQHPDLFCLPETAGLGSPYWMPDFPAVCSKTAASLSRETLLTIVLEGIVFRLCQVVKDLHGVKGSQTIVLSGGLANNTFISQGIADCLGQPVYVSKENEATLAGAGRLAAGLIHTVPEPGRYVHPAEERNHLARKFNDWQEWADRCVRLFLEGGEKLLAAHVKCRFLP